MTVNNLRNSYQKTTDPYCLGEKKHINHEINTSRKEKSLKTWYCLNTSFNEYAFVNRTDHPDFCALETDREVFTDTNKRGECTTPYLFPNSDFNPTGRHL